MLTADTITDAEIRAMLAKSEMGTEECDVATRALDTHPITGARPTWARARCAEILNARGRAKEAK